MCKEHYKVFKCKHRVHFGTVKCGGIVVWFNIGAQCIEGTHLEYIKVICTDCQAQANASATPLPLSLVIEQQETTASIIKQERTCLDSVGIDSAPAATQEKPKDNTRRGKRKRLYENMLKELNVTNKWVEKMNQKFWEWAESNTMTHNEVLESLRPKATPRRKQFQNATETAAMVSLDDKLLAEAIADDKWTRNIMSGTSWL